DAEQLDAEFANTDILKESIEEIIPQLDASRAKIQSAKTSEDLKQVLRSTNLELTSTSDKISEEKSRISSASQQILAELTNKVDEEKQASEPPNNETNLEEVTASKTDTNPTASAELKESPSSNSDKAELSYEQRLEAISAARTEISELQNRVTTQQQEVINVGKSISNENKLKKSGIEAVENLVAEQISTNREIAALNVDLAKLQDNNARPEKSNPYQSEIENKISELPKLKSKEDAIVLLDALNADLTNSQSFLTEKRTSVKNQQTKLNQLGVVKTKVRLMEKMSTKNGMASSLSEADLEKRASALTAELEALKSDSSLVSLIGSNEISSLLGRVDEVKSTITSDAVDMEQANSSAKEQVAEEVKNGQTADIKKPKSENKPPTVEEIENAPPKETGGFMWADVNGNGWISPDEVLYFIDLLFEGEAVRTVEDIQNLIDYYFDQE
ncbi:MAG TPA: hypothetical protein DCR04_06665, partial [Flavobacteriales bacterium]|nr:hypothetical protein [Flavobacteriales bacterium]